MDHLPLNRLKCAGCRSFRSIFEYPFRVDGCRCNTCYYCWWLKDGVTDPFSRYGTQEPLEQLPEHQQPLQQTSQECQPSSPITPRYCSSCNQRRDPSQFNGFKTCEICRATNRKTQYRKYQRHVNKCPCPQPSRQDLGRAHLQIWVEKAGEQELHSDHHGLFHPKYKRQPLTIDDYFQDLDPQQVAHLRQKYKERQARTLHRRELQRQREERIERERHEWEERLKRERHEREERLRRIERKRYEREEQLLQDPLEQHRIYKEGQVNNKTVEVIYWDEGDIPIYAFRR